MVICHMDTIHGTVACCKRVESGEVKESPKIVRNRDCGQLDCAKSSFSSATMVHN